MQDTASEYEPGPCGGQVTTDALRLMAAEIRALSAAAIQTPSEDLLRVARQE